MQLWLFWEKKVKSGEGLGQPLEPDSGEGKNAVQFTKYEYVNRVLAKYLSFLRSSGKQGGLDEKKGWGKW